MNSRTHTGLSAAVAFLVTTWAVTAAAEVPPPLKQFGYDKGFFLRTENGDYGLLINSRFKPRFDFENHQTNADGDRESKIARFSVPVARLKLSGNIFVKALTYSFEAEFGGGVPFMQDYFADYAVVPGWFHVRVGQWKRPYSRQFIQNDGQTQFIDAADIAKLGASRDIGLAFGNGYEQSPMIEWVIGVFNGTGIAADLTKTKFFNVPDKFNPMLVARVGYNFGGIKGYSEGDLEGGGFRFAVGASGQIDFDLPDKNKGNIKAQLDTIFKIAGFSFSGGVYGGWKQYTDAFSDLEKDFIGGFAQAGFVINKIVEPVVRFSASAPKGPNNDVMDVAAGVNVFFWGTHLAKWQLVYIAKLEEKAGVDKRFVAHILQTQFHIGF